MSQTGTCSSSGNTNSYTLGPQGVGTNMLQSSGAVYFDSTNYTLVEDAANFTLSTTIKAGQHAVCVTGWSGTSYVVRHVEVHGVNSAKITQHHAGVSLNYVNGNVHASGATDPTGFVKPRAREQFNVVLEGWGLLDPQAAMSDKEWKFRSSHMTNSDTDIYEYRLKHQVWIEDRIQFTGADACKNSGSNSAAYNASTWPTLALSEASADNDRIDGRMYLYPYYDQSQSNFTHLTFKDVVVPFAGKYRVCWENPFDITIQALDNNMLPLDHATNLYSVHGQEDAQKKVVSGINTENFAPGSLPGNMAATWALLDKLDIRGPVKMEYTLYTRDSGVSGITQRDINSSPKSIDSAAANGEQLNFKVGEEFSLAVTFVGWDDSAESQGSGSSG